MLKDATIRLNYINAIVKAIELQVDKSWSATCKLIAAENAQLHDVVMPELFKFKQDYFPPSTAEMYAKQHLRKRVQELHKDMHEEFVELHALFVKDYRAFMGKFKHMLGDLCRQATSIDCFELVLPNVLLKPTHELSYVPMRTAKGLVDTPEDFIKKYKEVLDQAVYYSTIRQLI